VYFLLYRKKAKQLEKGEITAVRELGYLLPISDYLTVRQSHSNVGKLYKGDTPCFYQCSTSENKNCWACMLLSFFLT